MRRSVHHLKILVSIATLGLSLSSCYSDSEPNRPLRILLNQPPLSLNPRRSIDAVGQRLVHLLFASLTQIDSNLGVKPERAEKWKTTDGGKQWRFTLPENKLDGEYVITPEEWGRCLESYRAHMPVSPLLSSFPGWVGTQVEGHDIILQFENPYPFAPIQVSALRFFKTTQGRICEDPMDGEALVPSGPFSVDGDQLFNLRPEASLTVHERNKNSRRFEFQFVQDENSRVLLLLHGSVDVAFNATMASKVEWLKSFKEKDKKLEIIERNGTSVSYLAFNFRSKFTSNPVIRKAIAHAIPRQDISQYRMHGFTQLADSFFSSELSNAPATHPLSYDLDEAEKILEQAGFQKKTDGYRFALTYITTPVREGFETALAIQATLKRIGIRLNLHVVEPALFFSAIQGNGYDLYSSRWIGVQDETLWQLALHSKSSRNRTGYSSPAADQLIDELMRTLEPEGRMKISQKLQILFEEDLPYFPLWFWNNALITQKGVDGLQSNDISLSGDYMPLTRLRRNENL